MADTAVASPLFGGTLPVFPRESRALEKFGLKFTVGGAHISRTMMLSELAAVLAAVPIGSMPNAYRKAVLQDNVLGKTTQSTRAKSLRHLRELYALDESTPVFSTLRRLHAADRLSLPILAIQVAWARDPLFRATSPPVLEAAEGERVATSVLATALERALPGHYSALNRNKISRNAASSWTQSGHLVGRSNKQRVRVKPSSAGVAMALYFGSAAGNHGSSIFSSPWCRLIDLLPDRARFLAFEAHRAGLIDLRAIGEIVDLRFPLFPDMSESR